MTERGRARDGDGAQSAERGEERRRAGTLRADALRLRHLMVRGVLTEADAFEVQETLELLIERVQSGAITEHFARLVIQKLADDKLDQLLYRSREL